ncbi:thioredoxin fold domain-containing protein [Cysteiniphilum marinum]|uniref:thioredoxin fold domain-containing protein n=1 Tax=Cysteiniphilum marinum TaxID=2774191 RepID=UPI00193AB82F|nr:thioredoxin fold domain-containing protein [Cysteiniphilum marinum]
MENTRKIKKTITTILLSTFACSAFANSELLTSGTHVTVKAIAVEKTQSALLLAPIKESIPSLIVLDIKDSKIGSYKAINSNAGMLFVDDSGNVLMGGQQVMLINYQNNELKSVDGIKKVIEESTGYRVTEYNKDGGLYYFKAGSVTIVTDNNIAKTPYALMGAFTTTQQLLQLKNQVMNDASKEKAVREAAELKPIEKIEESQQNTPSAKAQGMQKALAYVETNYPDNLVQYKTEAKNPKATLTIFTDYSCPNCKVLHQQLPNLLKQGFNVNYILMPRAGITSTVAQNMQKALCAENPQEVTQYLYEYQQLPTDIQERENCSIDIKNNLSLATGFNVTGTPMIIASNGKVTSGFSSVYGMLAKLNLAQN